MNFPLLMASWKLGAALATGNVVVLKSAEDTPLSALYLAELIQEAEFPEGVVNIISGYGHIAGTAMTKHPRIRKIAFTGSTEVGKIIMRDASHNVKRVTLELGGKSPNIIFPDADFSKAIPGALHSIFFNQGQICSAGSRLFVHKKIYDNFLSDMASEASKLKVGPGLDEETQVGALVSAKQYETVRGYLKKGKEEGAKALTGGVPFLKKRLIKTGSKHIYGSGFDNFASPVDVDAIVPAFAWLKQQYILNRGKGTSEFPLPHDIFDPHSFTVGRSYALQFQTSGWMRAG